LAIFLTAGQPRMLKVFPLEAFMSFPSISCVRRIPARLRTTRLILITTGLGVSLSGCGPEMLACTQNIEAISATIVNQVGQTLPGLEVTDTVRRTGTVLTMTEPPLQDLPSEGATVMVFSDDFQKNIRPGGEDVAVMISAGGHSVSSLFRFGSDGCHVQKLAGPDSLIVS
jgi:hypothetical protein